ncbi:MAG: hypothetical protein JWO94_776, partial [Verrucomicrobiaceae bacterium]|nr:hypothetical protein [Verrucomicrobiaceae bacterium]
LLGSGLVKEKVAAPARAWGVWLGNGMGPLLPPSCEGSYFESALDKSKVAAPARAWGGGLGNGMRTFPPPSCEGIYLGKRVGQDKSSCARKGVGPWGRGRWAWQRHEAAPFTFLRRQLLGERDHAARLRKILASPAIPHHTTLSRSTATPRASGTSFTDRASLARPVKVHSSMPWPCTVTMCSKPVAVG